MFFCSFIYEVSLEISKTRYNLYEYNTLGLLGAAVKHLYNRHGFPRTFAFVNAAAMRNSNNTFTLFHCVFA